MPELRKCQKNDKIFNDVCDKQLLNDLDMNNRYSEIINKEVIKCECDSENESLMIKCECISDTLQVPENTSNNLAIGNIDEKLNVSSSELELKEVVEIINDTANLEICTSGSTNQLEIETEQNSLGQNGISSTLLPGDKNKKNPNIKFIKDITEYEKKEENRSNYNGFVEELAAEITEMIFLMLGPEDLASCSMVCKSWRDAINSDIIWRPLCRQRGWTKTLSDWCCFQKSAHIWLGVSLGNDINSDKLSSLCKQRQFFNKYVFLLKFWNERKFSVFHVTKFSRLENYLSIFPCNGKYLVMPNNGQLLVWELENVPRKIDCSLCFQTEVSNIHVSYDLIAVVQGPYISVYNIKATGFELAYIKSEFVEIDTMFFQHWSSETSRVILELDNNYLIACADHIDSPTYVWDRKSGICLQTITFESINSSLTAMNLYGSSLFFVRKISEDIENIVEYNLNLKCWTTFSVSISHPFKQLAVNDDYFCLVTVLNEMRGTRNNICIWNRDTGEIVKKFKGCGKSYQFVNNCLVYFHNARVIVQPMKEDGLLREIYSSEHIINLRPVFDNLFVISTRDKVEVWDWILKKKLYIAFYLPNSNFEMWVDYEKIVLLSSNLREFIILRF